MTLLIPALGLCAAWAGLTLLDDAPGPAGALLFIAAVAALSTARLLTSHETTPPRPGRVSGAMRGLLRAARRPGPEAPTCPDIPAGSVVDAQAWGTPTDAPDPADSSWGRIDTPPRAGPAATATPGPSRPSRPRPRRRRAGRGTSPPTRYGDDGPCHADPTNATSPRSSAPSPKAADTPGSPW